MELIFFIQCFFSVMFSISFIVKLKNISGFIETVSSIISNLFVAKISAYFFLILEALAAITIAFNTTKLFGEVIILMLLLAFLISNLLVQFKKQKIKCNCFGKLSEEFLGDKVSYYRITVLGLLLGTLIFFRRSQTGIELVPLNTTLNLFLSSIAVMLTYFLINTYIHLMYMRRNKY
ncbi:MauE/DoxX family redox-associated membrane protein [Bacillus licheniformis]|uniref:MauE/DoxX family redox-associated membrane protein n=2 Tax=Bacillus licheniformis TaxID=1402 RepID=UPI0011A4E207|nr:MauE/DoxX family redox-associated membrane protein [Bacillus licheniformis]